MAVASRLLSNAADSVWHTQEEDLTGVGGGMAWLWATELPQTVAQHVVDRRCRVGGASQAGVPGHLQALSQRYFEGRVPRANETEYSMILNGLDSAHLLLHLLDLGLKANKLDIHTALASIRDTAAVVALVGGIDRGPTAAQLTAGLWPPLLHLAGATLARNHLGADEFSTVLDIAHLAANVIVDLGAEAQAAALALVYVLRLQHRGSADDCITVLARLCSGPASFSSKSDQSQLKIAFGQLLIKLFDAEACLPAGLSGCIFVLLGDRNRGVRDVWSQVAGCLVALPFQSPIPGPFAAQGCAIQNNHFQALSGREVNECVRSLSTDDAMMIVKLVVDSCVDAGQDSASSAIGLSAMALDCAIAIYRAAFGCHPGASVFEIISVVVSSAARRLRRVNPHYMLTVNHLIKTIRTRMQQRERGKDIAGLFWALEMLFILCQPNNVLFAILEDADTQLLLLEAAILCSNLAFAVFICQAAVQTLDKGTIQVSGKVDGDSARDLDATLGMLAQVAPWPVLNQLLGGDMGDVIQRLMEHSVSVAEGDLENALSSLQVSDDSDFGFGTQRGVTASTRLAVFDISVAGVPEPLAVQINASSDYLSSHASGLFLADRFLDCMVIRATQSLTPKPRLQLFADTVYSAAAANPDGPQWLAAIKHAFGHGEISPARAVALLQSYMVADRLDQEESVGQWWSVYTASTIASAYETRGLLCAPSKLAWPSIPADQRAVDIVVHAVPASHRVDLCFAHVPQLGLEGHIQDPFVSDFTDFRGVVDLGAMAGAGVDATKAKEVLLYLSSGSAASDYTNGLNTDLLMEGSGKVRFTATGTFDPASQLIAHMSTQPACPPTLLTVDFNANAVMQMANYIPQLFAMLSYKHTGSLDSQPTDITISHNALGILECLAASDPDLIMFHAVVASRSLPKTSRASQLVAHLLQRFDQVIVADIRVFLSLASGIAILPQEKLRQVCVGARSAHRQAVAKYLSATGDSNSRGDNSKAREAAESAISESLRPVYKMLAEFADREPLPAVCMDAKFVAGLPRLNVLFDHLSVLPADDAPCSGGPRDLVNAHVFDAVWSEVFKLISMRSEMLMSQLCPQLAQFKSAIPIPSLKTPTEPTYFLNFGSTVRTIVSKTRPKLLSLGMTTKSGNTVQEKYILKGGEDLRIDESVIQAFMRLNRIIGSSKGGAGDGQGGSLTVYNIVPIDAYGGLIQVVDHLPSLFDVYSKDRAAGIAGLRESYTSHTKDVLKRANLATTTPAEEWPHRIWVDIYDSLTSSVAAPAYMFYNFLSESAQSSSHHYLLMKNMARSIGITSIAGYVLGLGDRHLANLLVDVRSGRLVHIDFNMCFDMGGMMQMPEQVPFRMTPILAYLCGCPHDHDVAKRPFAFSRLFKGAAMAMLKFARMDRNTL
ncbi:hypothetical protein GGF37_002418, partial [Kickxella alabastrina]